MPIDITAFRVREGGSVNLKKWPTRVRPLSDSKSQYESLLADHVKKLSERQSLLYAHDRYALLLIFQAMDGAGKDGAIKPRWSG